MVGVPLRDVMGKKAKQKKTQKPRIYHQDIKISNQKGQGKQRRGKRRENGLDEAVVKSWTLMDIQRRHMIHPALGTWY